MSLVRYFKKNPVLQTDIGQFEFEADIGQGGNANVLKFKRCERAFAIKFIAHGDDGKLRRFRDEFFGAAQIPTQKNVVNCYHFDSKVIDGNEYSLIVMKFYDSNLSKFGHVATSPQHEQQEQGWSLFVDLCKGLHHLHTNQIIHRDIKPQNIFFDADACSFVIGDLGIAHFKAEAFAKEALTKPTERLANYLFSAPEQADSKNPITVAADIYSLGQVMQWYFTGNTIRGLGRRSFATSSASDHMSIIDAVVNKALRHEPADRFQSIEEISTFIEDRKKPERDPWVKIHAFDDVIRRSFPQIGKTLTVKDHDQIATFLAQFQKDCDPKEFWYMMADGGDGHFEGLEHLDGRKWLLNEDTEITVNMLLVYRDNSHLYKNFFILLFGPEKHFVYSNRENKRIKRKPTSGWDRDVATLVDGKFYIDPEETKNGYYRENNETFPVDSERFKERWRYLVPYGVMIVPTETASASMHDRTPTSDLIQAAVREKTLCEEDLKAYLKATRGHHSSEITKFN